MNTSPETDQTTGRMFTNEQVTVLLQGIARSRVAETPDGMSHVEGHDVRATLTRMFGFGMWDDTAAEPTTMLYETPGETKGYNGNPGKPAFTVAYRASRRLVVRDCNGNVCAYEGTAVGEAKMPDYKRGDTHDMAIKTAETQALKRAAANLGDAFGLSLYKQGSTAPIVRKIVGFNSAEGQPGWKEKTDGK